MVEPEPVFWEVPPEVLEFAQLTNKLVIPVAIDPAPLDTVQICPLGWVLTVME